MGPFESGCMGVDWLVLVVASPSGVEMMTLVASWMAKVGGGRAAIEAETDNDSVLCSICPAPRWCLLV